MDRATRGIRNNNPLNIRKGTKWKGLRAEQTDKDFCQFESMTYGMRAGLKLLINYVSGNNSAHIPFNTIRKVISRWAPPSENATEKYIDFVSRETGISDGAVLRADDASLLIPVAIAMAFVECGQWTDANMWWSAWALI